MDQKLKDVALRIAGDIEEKTGLLYRIEDAESPRRIWIHLSAKKYQIGLAAVVHIENEFKIVSRASACTAIEMEEFLDSLEFKINHLEH